MPHSYIYPNANINSSITNAPTIITQPTINTQNGNILHIKGLINNNNKTTPQRPSIQHEISSSTAKEQEQSCNICRICYDPQTESNFLLSPCQCEGSMKYIHSLCLKEWIIKQPHNSRMLSCEICHEPYSLQLEQKITFSYEKYKKYRMKAFVIVGILSLLLILAGIAVYFCIDRISINEKVKRKYIIAMTVLMICVYLILVYGVFYSIRQKCLDVQTDIVDIKNYEKKSDEGEQGQENNNNNNRPLTVLVINNYLVNAS